MKSRTSRPRSPTSAITFTSASVFRAIIPRSVLFPTPLPEKYAYALTLAAGQHAVNRPYSERQRVVSAAAAWRAAAFD